MQAEWGGKVQEAQAAGERQLAAVQATVAARDASIVQLQAELEGRDGAIAGLQGEVAELEAGKAELARQVGGRVGAWGAGMRVPARDAGPALRRRQPYAAP